jgi:hypothetical protein
MPADELRHWLRGLAQREPGTPAERLWAPVRS